jgi:hypothetical protein
MRKQTEFITIPLFSVLVGVLSDDCLTKSAKLIFGVVPNNGLSVVDPNVVVEEGLVGIGN